MNGDGMMDKGPAVNGRKLMIIVIGGLLLFMVGSIFATVGIGRVFGQVLNKKAMENERKIGTQIMIQREAKQKN